jgi:hypothetical protein
MRVLHYHLWSLDLPHFPHYLINGTGFEEKVTTHSVYFTSLRLAVWNISHSKNIFREIDHKYTQLFLPVILIRFRCFVCEYFVTKIRFHSEVLLAPRPTPKLEDHTLSPVRDCLFNIFAATLNIGGRSSIRNLRTRHTVVTGTHLSHEERTGSWWGNLRERDYWGDPGVDGRIILRWIFRKWDVRVFTGLSWFMIQMAGTCECGNEPSGSIKCGEFLD